MSCCHQKYTENPRAMWRVGLSYKTFKGGKGSIPFFGVIKSSLERMSDCKVEMIDAYDLDSYTNKHYDLIVSFSYFSDPPRGADQPARVNTEKLNYDNILYIESPICHDLLKNAFRLSLNSIYFCDNQLPDCISDFNSKRIVPAKRNESHGDGILILLQNPLQYFINQEYDGYEKMLNEIIADIRKNSDKRIIVRYKPGREQRMNLIDPLNNMEISNTSLLEDSKRCYKCVSHATNAVSACVYYGMDIVSLSRHNIAYNFSEKDFENVDAFNRVDYSELKKQILSCAYQLGDMKSDRFLDLMEAIRNA